MNKMDRMTKFLFELFLGLVIVGMAIMCFVGCAQMNTNDGLVPRMSAQANLPYTPAVAPNGLLAAPSGHTPTVSPLNETRKAYWSTP